MPLFRTYLGIPRNVGPRNKRGDFSIRCLQVLARVIMAFQLKPIRIVGD